MIEDIVCANIVLVSVGNERFKQAGGGGVAR